MTMNILLLQVGGLGLTSFLPIVAIFAIFYFLVIRPQKKQQEKLKEMISVLQNGDEIVTNGGIIGKIIEVKDTSFIVRSAGKSNLEIGKAAVVGRKSAEEVSK